MAELDRQLGELAAELDRIAPPPRRTGAAAPSGRKAWPAEVAEQTRPIAAAAWPTGKANWAACEQRHTAAAERAAVLEELERRQEGLSAGVKEVLAQAGSPGERPVQGGLRAGGRSVVRERRGGAAGGRRPWARRRSTSWPRAEQGIVGALAGPVAAFGRPRGLLSGWTATVAGDCRGRSRSRRAARGAGPRRSLRRDPAALCPPGPAAAGADLDRRETLAHALELARSAGRGIELRHPGGRIAGGRRHAGCRAAASGRRIDLAAKPTPRIEGPVGRVGGAGSPRPRPRLPACRSGSPLSGRASAANGRTSPGAGRRGRASPEDLRRRGAPRQFDQQRGAAR